MEATIDSAFPEFQASVLIGKRTGDRLLAPLSGAAAFLFFLLLTPHCLPAGMPADLTATAMGFPAQSVPYHLLWRLLAGVMTWVPFGTMTGKLALLSAVCGALAACLVYQVSVEILMYQLIPNGTQIDRLKMRAIQVGGVVAALAFAVSSPVTLAATRASLRSLDVLLLLLVIWLFLRYYNGGNVSNLLLAGVACGFGMGENPACCLAFLTVLPWGILLLWRQDRSTLPMLAFAGLALVSMLLVYPGICYLWHVPGSGLGGLLAEHARAIVQDYVATRTGMLLGALSLLPLILAVATMNQTLNYSEDYESLLTLSALGVAALLVLTGALAVFRHMLELCPEPPVLPYLFAAMTAGFVSAGWWTVALSPVAPGVEIDETDLHHPGTPQVVKGVGYGAALTIAAGVLCAAVVTAHCLLRRPDWYPQCCAETILQELGSRHWLFGQTPGNTHLAVLARDRKIPLQVVSLSPDAAWSARVRPRVEAAVLGDAVFADLDVGRLLEGLALGPDAFLRAWLLADAHAADKLAVAGSPLLWSACGYAPAPALFFFSGSPRPHVPDRDFAERISQAEALRQRAEASGFVDGAMSSVLASADQALFASAAYAMAAYRSAGATNLAARLALYWDPLQVSVAHSRIFVAPLAWIWETTVLPGRLETADILHTIRAGEMLATLERKDDALLARQAMSGGAPRPLRGATADFSELYALARDSADLAMINQTFSWLAQLDQAGSPAAPLLTLRAEAHLALTNDADQATALLREAVSSQPRDLWAWHLLAVACLQRGACDPVEQEILPAMERAAGDRGNALLRLTRALMLAARGGASLRPARNLFAEVADAVPDLAAAREWALRLDLLLNDTTAAARDARILVAGNENHAQANYVLAMFAVRTRQLAEADIRFRQSLTGAMTPQALVGRARLYCQRRMYTDALQLSRKVTGEYPDYPDGRLVLADALEATGQPGEAAVERARATAPRPRQE